MLLIFSATIVDFEMTFEGAYRYYLKETKSHFAYRFDVSIKEKDVQPTIGKYNVLITETQFNSSAHQRQ